MPEVVDNPEASRYEISVEGEVVGYAAYRKGDNRVAFTSTHVQPEFQNRGLAAQLASRGLDDARAAQLKVDPVCPYFVVFVKRHPEYDDLVN